MAQTTTNRNFYSICRDYNVMVIHFIKDNELIEYLRTSVNKEIEIEEFIEKHPTILDKDIFIIGRQVPTETKTRIDLMGLDRDGNVIIIEIKKGVSSREVVSQILEYGVWAEGIQYEDLNKIAKEKHLKNYPDLYKKFEHDFKSIPEPFNQNQRLYIVAENIDEKIEQTCRYLRVRGIDIKCIELNFYERDGHRLVDTKTVVGTEETIYQELEDDTQTIKLTWSDKLELATSENKKTILELISNIEHKFECKGEPHNRWYFIYAKEPFERKNCFAVIMCGKERGRIAFRINPDSFNISDDEIRKIIGWFFPKGSERRIFTTKENFPLIMKCLEHAYEYTLSLIQSKPH